MTQGARWTQPLPRWGVGEGGVKGGIQITTQIDLVYPTAAGPKWSHQLTDLPAPPCLALSNPIPHSTVLSTSSTCPVLCPLSRFACAAPPSHSPFPLPSPRSWGIFLIPPQLPGWAPPEQPGLLASKPSPLLQLLTQYLSPPVAFNSF